MACGQEISLQYVVVVVVVVVVVSHIQRIVVLLVNKQRIICLRERMFFSMIS